MINLVKHFRKVDVDNIYLALDGKGVEYERNDYKISGDCRETRMAAVLFIDENVIK